MKIEMPVFRSDMHDCSGREARTCLPLGQPVLTDADTLFIDDDWRNSDLALFA